MESDRLRKGKKQQLLPCKAVDKDTLPQEYHEMNVQVKKSVRRDKRTYVDSLGKEAREAADRGDTRTVYKVIKTLTGNLAANQQL